MTATAPNTPPPAEGWDALYAYLATSPGCDFRAYKVDTLRRRIQKRMQALGITSFTEYRDRLIAHADELGPMLETMLINVTRFFRDADAWTVLRNDVIPAILDAKGPDEPVRAWSAGCASGPEAYTLAMVLAEALGERAAERLQIYATDWDNDALGSARRGAYTPAEMADVPPELAERYFEVAGNQWVARRPFRRMITFGQHDLLRDVPISRIDLLVCRNTLMYLTPESQTRVLHRFHFALQNGGFLFLGRSERLPLQGGQFVVTSPRHRIARKVPRPALVPGADGEDQPARLRDAALDANPVGQIILDRGGRLLLANRRARALFGWSVIELGRPLTDIGLPFADPSVLDELRAAARHREWRTIRSVAWRLPDGGTASYDLETQPLMVSPTDFLGTSITFTDVTDRCRLEHDVRRMRQDLGDWTTLVPG